MGAEHDSPAKYAVGSRNLPRGSVSRAHDAFFRLDDAQVFDNFEDAVACLGDTYSAGRDAVRAPSQQDHPASRQSSRGSMA